MLFFDNRPVSRRIPRLIASPEFTAGNMEVSYAVPSSHDLLLFLLFPLSRISKDTSVSICVSRNKDGLVCVIPVKVSNFYVWIFYSSLCSKLGNLLLYFIIFILLYLLTNLTDISVVIVNLLPFLFLSWIFLLFQLWNKSIEFSIHALSAFSILQRIHWIFYFQILRSFSILEWINWIFYIWILCPFHCRIHFRFISFFVTLKSFIMFLLS